MRGAFFKKGDIKMAQEQINVVINDGEPFFAHEVTVNFTPAQISMDFKCVTPRTDPRSKKPSFLLKHNVVMMDPWHAKSVYEVLGTVIKKYEDEFGKIKKPKALEIAEKKQKELTKDMSQHGTEQPNYFG